MVRRTDRATAQSQPKAFQSLGREPRSLLVRDALRPYERPRRSLLHGPSHKPPSNRPKLQTKQSLSSSHPPTVHNARFRVDRQMPVTRGQSSKSQANQESDVVHFITLLKSRQMRRPERQQPRRYLGHSAIGHSQVPASHPPSK